MYVSELSKFDAVRLWIDGRLALEPLTFSIDTSPPPPPEHPGDNQAVRHTAHDLAQSLTWAAHTVEMATHQGATDVGRLTSTEPNTSQFLVDLDQIGGGPSDELFARLLCCPFTTLHTDGGQSGRLTEHRADGTVRGQRAEALLAVALSRAQLEVALDWPSRHGPQWGKRRGPGGLTGMLAVAISALGPNHDAVEDAVSAAGCWPPLDAALAATVRRHAMLDDIVGRYATPAQPGFFTDLQVAPHAATILDLALSNSASREEHVTAAWHGGVATWCEGDASDAKFVGHPLQVALRCGTHPRAPTDVTLEWLDAVGTVHGANADQLQVAIEATLTAPTDDRVAALTRAGSAQDKARVIAQVPLPASEAARLASMTTKGVREALGRCPHPLPDEVWMDLAENGPDEVRREVAANPAAPEHAQTLAALVHA